MIKAQNVPNDLLSDLETVAKRRTNPLITKAHRLPAHLAGFIFHLALDYRLPRSAFDRLRLCITPKIRREGKDI